MSEQERIVLKTPPEDVEGLVMRVFDSVVTAISDLSRVEHKVSHATSLPRH